MPFEVPQNAVREKHATLEELTLLKVRSWLVLEYFVGTGKIFGTGIPVALFKREGRGVVKIRDQPINTLKLFS